MGGGTYMKDFQIQWQLVLTNVELRNEMGGEGKKAHLIARQVMHNAGATITPSGVLDLTGCSPEHQPSLAELFASLSSRGRPGGASC